MKILIVTSLLIVVALAQEDGPCRILNNGMKCTASGYFELVQCDANSCYCVQAQNGEVAYDTRAKNKQTAPICSLCFNRLKQLFERGQPHRDSYIPLCDNRKGDFQTVQCTADRRTCFCVDPKTGKEITGTKRAINGSEVLVCDDIPSNNGQFPTATTSLTVYPVGKESCKLDRDRGHRCNGATPNTYWYFDVQTFECLAFEYLGCGGNDNRYPTKAACSFGCKLPDLSGCSGMFPPAKGKNGQALTCGEALLSGLAPDAPRGMTPPILLRGMPVGEPVNPDSECPKGTKCVMGAFVGVCCSNENEAKYSRNYHPICGNHRQPSRINNPDYIQYLLGKSCWDNFCPHGTVCEQGSVFAYCC